MVDTPPPAEAAAPGAKDHQVALSLQPLSAKLRQHFSIGVAVAPEHLTDMAEVITHHFNRLTAENAMKMGPMCPSPNCDFTDADKIATFARRHRMPVNGHTFVWHQMNPDWVFQDGAADASTDVLSARLRDHIFTLTARYADVVDNWDVVNEGISDTAGKTYRDASEGSRWYGAFGSNEYIRLAFQYATAAAEAHDPTVKLYYNDYNVVVPEKRKKIIEMVRWLRAEGVRVDGVGMQAHWNLESPSADAIRSAIDELAAEKLEVKISELDVNMYWKDDHGAKVWQPELALSPELEQRLTARYVEIFEVLLEKSALLAHVTLWGVDDGRSWLNEWPTPRENHPLLFDRDHQPKPALKAILAR